MKITITPDTEEEKKQCKETILENVYQYGLTGCMMREKLVPGTFCYSHVQNFNELLKEIRFLELNVEDSKRNNGNTKT